MRFTQATKSHIGWPLIISAVCLMLTPKTLMIGLVWLAAGLPLTLWRDGITLDITARKVRVWSGPLFPLWSTFYPLESFAFVSLIEDSQEISSRSSPFTRVYASSLGLKLQPLLTAETLFPEDLPPTLLLRSFSPRSRKKAQKTGRELAMQLKLSFRELAP